MGKESFYQGEPCQFGHTGRRYISNNFCAECSKTYHKRRYIRRKDDPARQYQSQKAAAQVRGIPFLLTFEEWQTWWLSNGHYHERGKGPGQYVMGRIGDTGPYQLGNIVCITFADNVADGHRKDS